MSREQKLAIALVVALALGFVALFIIATIDPVSAKAFDPQCLIYHCIKVKP